MNVKSFCESVDSKILSVWRRFMRKNAAWFGGKLLSDGAMFLEVKVVNAWEVLLSVLVQPLWISEIAAGPWSSCSNREANIKKVPIISLFIFSVLYFTCVFPSPCLQPFSSYSNWIFFVFSFFSSWNYCQPCWKRILQRPGTLSCLHWYPNGGGELAGRRKWTVLFMKQV